MASRPSATVSGSPTAGATSSPLLHHSSSSSSHHARSQSQQQSSMHIEPFEVVTSPMGLSAKKQAVTVANYYPVRAASASDASRQGALAMMRQTYAQYTQMHGGNSSRPASQQSTRSPQRSAKANTTTTSTSQADHHHAPSPVTLIGGELVPTDLVVELKDSAVFRFHSSPHHKSKKGTADEAALYRRRRDHVLHTTMGSGGSGTSVTTTPTGNAKNSRSATGGGEADTSPVRSPLRNPETKTLIPPPAGILVYNDRDGQGVEDDEEGTDGEDEDGNPTRGGNKKRLVTAASFAADPTEALLAIKPTPIPFSKAKLPAFTATDVARMRAAQQQQEEANINSTNATTPPPTIGRGIASGGGVRPIWGLRKTATTPPPTSSSSANLFGGSSSLQSRPVSRGIDEFQLAYAASVTQSRAGTANATGVGMSEPSSAVTSAGGKRAVTSASSTLFPSGPAHGEARQEDSLGESSSSSGDEGANGRNARKGTTAHRGGANNDGAASRKPLQRRQSSIRIVETSIPKDFGVGGNTDTNTSNNPFGGVLTSAQTSASLGGTTTSGGNSPLRKGGVTIAEGSFTAGGSSSINNPFGSSGTSGSFNQRLGAGGNNTTLAGMDESPDMHRLRSLRQRRRESEAALSTVGGAEGSMMNVRRGLSFERAGDDSTAAAGGGNSPKNTTTQGEEETLGSSSLYGRRRQSTKWVGLLSSTAAIMASVPLAAPDKSLKRMGSKVVTSELLSQYDSFVLNDLLPKDDERHLQERLAIAQRVKDIDDRDASDDDDGMMDDDDDDEYGVRFAPSKVKGNELPDGFWSRAARHKRAREKLLEGTRREIEDRIDHDQMMRALMAGSGGDAGGGNTNNTGGGQTANSAAFANLVRPYTSSRESRRLLQNAAGLQAVDERHAQQHGNGSSSPYSPARQQKKAVVGCSLSDESAAIDALRVLTMGSRGGVGSSRGGDGGGGKGRIGGTDAGGGMGSSTTSRPLTAKDFKIVTKDANDNYRLMPELPEGFAVCAPDFDDQTSHRMWKLEDEANVALPGTEEEHGYGKMPHRRLEDAITVTPSSTPSKANQSLQLQMIGGNSSAIGTASAPIANPFAVIEDGTATKHPAYIRDTDIIMGLTAAKQQQLERMRQKQMEEAAQQQQRTLTDRLSKPRQQSAAGTRKVGMSSNTNSRAGSVATSSVAASSVNNGGSNVSSTFPSIKNNARTSSNPSLNNLANSLLASRVGGGGARPGSSNGSIISSVVSQEKFRVRSASNGGGRGGVNTMNTTGTLGADIDTTEMSNHHLAAPAATYRPSSGDLLTRQYQLRALQGATERAAELTEQQTATGGTFSSGNGGTEGPFMSLGITATISSQRKKKCPLPLNTKALASGGVGANHSATNNSVLNSPLLHGLSPTNTSLRQHPATSDRPSTGQLGTHRSAQQVKLMHRRLRRAVQTGDMRMHMVRRRMEEEDPDGEGWKDLHHDEFDDNDGDEDDCSDDGYMGEEQLRHLHQSDSPTSRAAGGGSRSPANGGGMPAFGPGSAKLLNLDGTSRSNTSLSAMGRAYGRVGTAGSMSRAYQQQRKLFTVQDTATNAKTTAGGMNRLNSAANNGSQLNITRGSSASSSSATAGGANDELNETAFSGFGADDAEPIVWQFEAERIKLESRAEARSGGRGMQKDGQQYNSWTRSNGGRSPRGGPAGNAGNDSREPSYYSNADFDFENYDDDAEWTDVSNIDASSIFGGGAGTPRGRRRGSNMPLDLNFTQGSDGNHHPHNERSSNAIAGMNFYEYQQWLKAREQAGPERESKKLRAKIDRLERSLKAEVPNITIQFYNVTGLADSMSDAGDDSNFGNHRNSTANNGNSTPTTDKLNAASAGEVGSPHHGTSRSRSRNPKSNLASQSPDAAASSLTLDGSSMNTPAGGGERAPAARVGVEACAHMYWRPRGNIGSGAFGNSNGNSLGIALGSASGETSGPQSTSSTIPMLLTTQNYGNNNGNNNNNNEPQSIEELVAAKEYDPIPFKPNTRFTSEHETSMPPQELHMYQMYCANMNMVIVIRPISSAAPSMYAGNFFVPAKYCDEEGIPLPIDEIKEDLDFDQVRGFTTSACRIKGKGIGVSLKSSPYPPIEGFIPINPSLSKTYSEARRKERQLEDMLMRQTDEKKRGLEDHIKNASDKISMNLLAKIRAQHSMFGAATSVAMKDIEKSLETSRVKLMQLVQEYNEESAFTVDKLGVSEKYIDKLNEAQFLGKTTATWRGMELFYRQLGSELEVERDSDGRPVFYAKRGSLLYMYDPKTNELRKSHDAVLKFADVEKVMRRVEILTHKSFVISEQSKRIIKDPSKAFIIGPDFDGFCYSTAMSKQLFENPVAYMDLCARRVDTTNMPSMGLVSKLDINHILEARALTQWKQNHGYECSNTIKTQEISDGCHIAIMPSMEVRTLHNFIDILRFYRECWLRGYPTLLNPNWKVVLCNYTKLPLPYGDEISLPIVDDCGMALVAHSISIEGKSYDAVKMEALRVSKNLEEQIAVRKAQSPPGTRVVARSTLNSSSVVWQLAVALAKKALAEKFYAVRRWLLMPPCFLVNRRILVNERTYNRVALPPLSHDHEADRGRQKNIKSLMGDNTIDLENSVFGAQSSRETSHNNPAGSGVDGANGACFGLDGSQSETSNSNPTGSSLHQAMKALYMMVPISEDFEHLRAEKLKPLLAAFDEACNDFDACYGSENAEFTKTLRTFIEFQTEGDVTGGAAAAVLQGNGEVLAEILKAEMVMVRDPQAASHSVGNMSHLDSARSAVSAAGTANGGGSSSHSHGASSGPYFSESNAPFYTGSMPFTHMQPTPLGPSPASAHISPATRNGSLSMAPSFGGGGTQQQQPLHHGGGSAHSLLPLPSSAGSMAPANSGLLISPRGTTNNNTTNMNTARGGGLNNTNTVVPHGSLIMTAAPSPNSSTSNMSSMSPATAATLSSNTATPSSRIDVNGGVSNTPVLRPRRASNAAAAPPKSFLLVPSAVPAGAKEFEGHRMNRSPSPSPRPAGGGDGHHHHGKK